MKFPTIKLVLAAGVLTLTLPACEKQLEEYNPSGLTAETVYTTPAGFETLVNAAYSYTRWWYGKEDGYSVSEMGTDLWHRGAGDVNPDLTEYTTLQGSSRALESMWGKLYAAVNLCNAGINRIGTSGMTDAQKKIREGELRFLRAFYYWHIVETWGGVHFTTEETTSVQTTANRTPEEAFYAQIFEDLNIAVANLPATTTDYGRVTKPAAEAFLAKMYLTRGQNKQAADLAQKVISGYGLSLQARYADLWSMTNLENKEILWAVNYSKELSLNDRVDATLFPEPYGHPRGGNNGHLLWLMKYDDQPGMTRDIANGRPFNRYMPSLFLLRLFDETKDSRYLASFKTVWYANNNRTAGLAIGDTAILATKREIPNSVESVKKYKTYDLSKTYNPATGAVTGDRLHYVCLRKFDDPTRPTIAEEQSARDAYVIRLADVYLMAAEAEFKQGNNAKAVELINVVRRRAAIPGRENAMLITASDLSLDFILDERARELAGEQLRWFDLKRTNKLVERVRKYNPEAQIQDYHTVRPIPQRQLDAIQNKNEFIQNQGYR